uniref:VPS37 C-terminal domain-containing protein n=1 Tax=Eutreptiella gymnastica TaxID=73025 RepID=A0A7S4G6G0_9EUGL|eukprot:CAMPEP_0174298402 /NCGR_PEP_ID=MMETSP0809-20121228/53644_1 /TAXON_ID=73025 ORGANISM="Eutreptiella gymnastica-like, Strain CCMP1594" /NCGR_SAMPLE_ID=MMETSP0809 /ASSEMBLY_ACC=CAM_ASM_000658 /LENGTH=174 /DNA_ID=CAMNT_0015402821 /DNA_START=35 /DNA_END=559 /DNA_ORIENTATION=+
MAQNRDFPEVQTLGSDELKTLIDDDVAFEQFFNNLAIIKNRKALNEDVQRGNEDMATANLSMKAEIEALKEEITDLSNVARVQKAELDTKLARKQELMERHSPQVLLGRLTTAVAQAEEHSDATAEAFHQGSMKDEAALKQFIQLYTDQRKQYHMRKLKLDGFVDMFGDGQGRP